MKEIRSKTISESLSQIGKNKTQKLGQILFRIFAIRRYTAECYQFIPIQV